MGLWIYCSHFFKQLIKSVSKTTCCFMIHTSQICFSISLREMLTDRAMKWSWKNTWAILALLLTEKLEKALGVNLGAHPLQVLSDCQVAAVKNKILDTVRQPRSTFNLMFSVTIVSNIKSFVSIFLQWIYICNGQKFIIFTS